MLLLNDTNATANIFRSKSKVSLLNFYETFIGTIKHLLINVATHERKVIHLEEKCTIIFQPS